MGAGSWDHALNHQRPLCFQLMCPTPLPHMCKALNKDLSTERWFNQCAHEETENIKTKKHRGYIYRPRSEGQLGKQLWPKVSASWWLVISARPSWWPFKERASHDGRRERETGEQVLSIILHLAPMKATLPQPSWPTQVCTLRVINNYSLALLTFRNTQGGSVQEGSQAREGGDPAQVPTGCCLGQAFRDFK